MVLPAWWVFNVVEDWHFGPLRRFAEGLAAERMVVRYDRLGTGLSDRERPPETFTPDSWTLPMPRVLIDDLLERGNGGSDRRERPDFVAHVLCALAVARVVQHRPHRCADHRGVALC